MQRNSLILFFLLIVKYSSSAVFLKVMYIADYTVNCTNDTTKQCLLTRDAPTQAWLPFNYKIENFNYEKGFEYCILMEIQTQGVSEPALPFDSSQIKYVLSEIKSKTKKTSTSNEIEQQKNALQNNSQWILYKIKTKDGTKTFSVSKANIQFNTTSNIITGNTDCNDLNASFIQSNQQLSFSSITTTKMACKKRSIEPYFLEMLQKTNTFKIKKNILYLYNGNYLLGLFTKKK